MAELAHSKWSASKFEADMLCPGKHVLEQGLPNTTSKFAAEGTAAHQVLTWALQENLPASAYLGRIILVEDWSFEVDDEMAEHVQVCIDYVQAIAGTDGVVLVDQRVNYAGYLGVKEFDAWGTLDVAVLRDNVITGIDLKYGMGVEVSAGSEDGPNPQVALYCLGMLAAAQGLLGDFDTVRLVISQPRVTKAPSEYEMSVFDLETWADMVAKRAVGRCNLAAMNPNASEETWVKAYLKPSEKGCKFCKAKAYTDPETGAPKLCPALRNEVVVHVSAPASAAEFDEITDPKTFATPDLSRAMSKVDLIEDWCKAVRAETERRLLAGDGVPGFKLVQGKRGARQWANEEEAEKLLKSFRLKQEEMYSFKLISPTTAEKLAKAETIGKRQWPKLQELITQSDGKPHVAPETDSRPALDVRPVAEEFEALTDDLA